MSDKARNGRLLTIDGLRIHFTTHEGTARAVDEVSIDVGHGETLGVVGESGCGKSVTALSVMRLVPCPPGKIAGGRVLFRPDHNTDADDGAVDLLRLSDAEMCKIRGNQIGMIFQEPMTSLNPVFTVGDQIGESLRLHRGMRGMDLKMEVLRLLTEVRIPSPDKRMLEYPHQLSGGMRQRIMIAIALACDPALLLADEPTTALDVTVQAQILALMQRLSRERQGSVVLISHDLGVIAEVASRVVVMYAGEVVEEQPVESLFQDPLHPYTRGLLRSIPGRQVGQKKLHVIPGSVPSAGDYGKGCRFADRCGDKMEICEQRHPPLAQRKDGTKVRCFLHEECRPTAS